MVEYDSDWGSSRDPRRYIAAMNERNNSLRPVSSSLSSFFSSIASGVFFLFLAWIATPPTPIADNAAMANHNPAFAVSPVFGGLLVFIVVPGVSGVGVSGTSLMVTV